MDLEDRSSFTTLNYYYQSLFLLDMIVNCFVEYHYPCSTQIERNLKKLLVIYLEGRFMIDVIAIMPFAHLYEKLLGDGG